eukprot:UN05147
MVGQKRLHKSEGLWEISLQLMALVQIRRDLLEKGASENRKIYHLKLSDSGKGPSDDLSVPGGPNTNCGKHTGRQKAISKARKTSTAVN